MYTSNISPWQSSSFAQQQFVPMQSGVPLIQPWQTSSVVSPVQSFLPFQFSPQAQAYNMSMQTGAVNPSLWNVSLPFSSMVSSPVNYQGGFIPQSSPITYSFSPGFGWQQSISPMVSSQSGYINPQISSMISSQMGHINPISPMMQHQINPMGQQMTTGIRSSSGFAQPRIELAETNNDVVVTAELPNVDPNNIYLTVTDDSLSISALSHMGGISSSLHRTVVLPTQIRSEHMNVNYANGTLECRLPKSDYTARRRVKVNVTG